MVNDWSHLSHAQAPFRQEIYGGLVNACVNLYMRASFLNSGHRKEAEGLRAEPR